LKTVKNEKIHEFRVNPDTHFVKKLDQDIDLE
jgi:hypothetical protein